MEDVRVLRVVTPTGSNEHYPRDLVPEQARRVTRGTIFQGRDGRSNSREWGKGLRCARTRQII